MLENGGYCDSGRFCAQDAAAESDDRQAKVAGQADFVIIPAAFGTDDSGQGVAAEIARHLFAVAFGK